MFERARRHLGDSVQDNARRRLRVASFWYGERLTRLHWECVESFLLRGIGYDLFTYSPGLKAPPGCRIREAEQILPRSDIVHYKDVAGPSSIALFANHFRYMMLYRIGGWWVDTDVFQLRRSLPPGDAGYFRQDDDIISNAIIHTPAGCSVMEACYRRAVEMGGDAKWGVTGPQLLTKVLEEKGLSDSVHPAEAYNPVHWRRAWVTRAPKRREEVVSKTARSFGVHLWSAPQMKGGLDLDAPPPKWSFLDRLYQTNEVLRCEAPSAKAS